MRREAIGKRILIIQKSILKNIKKFMIHPYDYSNYNFTANADGYYMFDLTIACSNLATSGLLTVKLTTSAIIYGKLNTIRTIYTVDEPMNFTMKYYVEANVGDEFTFKCRSETDILIENYVLFISYNPSFQPR